MEEPEKPKDETVYDRMRRRNAEVERWRASGPDGEKKAQQIMDAHQYEQLGIVPTPLKALRSGWRGSIRRNMGFILFAVAVLIVIFHKELGLW